MGFVVVMYQCESWFIKKAKCWRINAFELWNWRKLLRVPLTARTSNQSILKKISPEYSLEGLVLKLKLQYFGNLMWKACWRAYGCLSLLFFPHRCRGHKEFSFSKERTLLLCLDAGLQDLLARGGGLFCPFLKDPQIKVNRKLDLCKSKLKKRIHLDFSIKKYFHKKAKWGGKKELCPYWPGSRWNKRPPWTLWVCLCVCMCVCIHVYTWVCACVCVCVYTCVHLSVISLEPQTLRADGPRSSGQSREGGLCSYKERGPGWGTSSPHTLWLEAHVSIIGWGQLTPFCKHPQNHCKWIVCLCVSL